MSMLSGAKQFLTEWIDAVSRAVDAMASRFAQPRRIRLVEGDDGMFRATAAPVKGKPGLPWSGYNSQHPLTAPFREWTRTTTADFTAPELQPLVNAFWAVTPVKDAVVIASYAEDAQRPVLVERSLGPDGLAEAHEDRPDPVGPADGSVA